MSTANLAYRLPLVWRRVSSMGVSRPESLNVESHWGVAAS